MMEKVIVLLAALIAASVAADGCGEEGCSFEIISDCGILGTWKNQLNSTVIFTSCKNGQLEGKYNTAVGQASDFYVLTGRYTLSGPDNNILELGWVVSWNNQKYGNSNSATSWNGIYYPTEGTIYTQWIFTRYVERTNLWTASLINHDEFTRE